MLRLKDMDRWALAAHALRLVDRARGTAEHAAQADEWDAFRDEAFQFAVDKGYDHPAFADWVWREVSDKASVTSAAKMTGGDNEDE